MFAHHARFDVVGVKYCLDISPQWLAPVAVTQVHVLLQVLHRMGVSNYRDLLHNSNCCLHRIFSNNETTKEAYWSLLTFQTVEMGHFFVPSCFVVGDYNYSCVLEYSVAWRKRPFSAKFDRWNDVSSVPMCLFDNWFLHEQDLLRDWLDLHLNRHLCCLRSCEHWRVRSFWNSCVLPDELGFGRQLVDWIVNATTCCWCVRGFIFPNEVEV